jgi:Transaldolase/Fructose-6-phosphate aldolase
MGRQHSESLDALPDSFHCGLWAPNRNTLCRGHLASLPQSFIPIAVRQDIDASIATQRPGLGRAIADDTQRTIAMAQDLHRRSDRSNVMVKIPATGAGLHAIRHMIGEGMHTNVMSFRSATVTS